MVRESNNRMMTNLVTNSCGVVSGGLLPRPSLGGSSEEMVSSLRDNELL